MDEARTFECPSCGGELTTDGLTPTIKCPYCGRTVSVPAEMRVQPAPAPQPAQESPFIPLMKAAEQYAQEERAERTREERETRPAPRRRGGCGCGSLIFAVVLILAVLVGAAIFTGNGPALVSALDTMSGATPTPRPISTVVTAGLLRATRYAGVTLSIAGAELTNAEPNVSGAPRYRSNQLYALLTVHLDNTAGSREVWLLPDVVRLHLDDGNQYQSDGSFEMDVPAGGTRSGKLVFRLPAGASLSGAQLIIGEPGMEPALLPLTGAVPPVPQPRDLKLSTEKTVGTIVYRVLDATVDTARDGRQTNQGKRFLRFKVRVINKGSEPGGALVSGSNFRLLLDGSSFAPDAAPIEAIPPKSQVDGNLDFTVPADAKAATLQVGALDGPQAEITVNLK